ncbi:MAG: fumarylacetoacetate hydrolase family protein, partial [Actinomycetota bacterium]|nr:fumarylacetoacetate hydrolase family protein [Actinomycetota bacterium]
MSHSLGLSPSKIIAVHLNFGSRAAERGRVPEVPSYFLKPPSSLASTGEDIVRPAGCELLTFEGEIALVIGTRARSVSRHDALRYVAGYAAANDVGLHDLRGVDRGSNLRSKGGDGYTPIGPVLLDARSTDPASLRLRTWVNGRLVQDADPTDLIFGFDYLVADLSRTITLEPGDIILTGTPTGSGILSPGDVVEVELGETGRLRNTVVAGPSLTGPGAAPVVTDIERQIAGSRAADLPQLAGVPATGSPRRPDGLSETTAAALLRVSTATISSQLRKAGLNETFIAGVRPG